MEQQSNLSFLLRKPLKTFLLDDTDKDLRTLRLLLEKHPDIFEITVCERYEDALSIFARNNFDVSILDYKLDSGKDTFDLLLAVQRNRFGIIVLSSIAVDELAVKSLEISEPILLAKPHTEEVINKFLLRLLERIEKIQERRVNTFTVRLAQNKYRKLAYENIYFIKANKKTSFFQCESQSLEHMELLKDVEKELDNRIFFRCHKSYIINLEKIDYCIYIKGENRAIVYFRKVNPEPDCLQLTAEASSIGIPNLKLWGFIRE